VNLPLQHSLSFNLTLSTPRTLKHVAQYSPLLADPVKRSIAATLQGSIKQRFSPGDLPLSELPQLLRKEITLDVPIYTVWGACEDVRVLEKFRSGEYKVDNLHIIDEANSRLLDIGGVKLRLLGLGGAVVMHKLFDNGEGKTTIAGGQGTMWTTLLQMGELVDTANRVYDPTETRVFVTHASPAREGMLNQLSVTLKADFSISAGLHFRYGSSYNEFSVNPTLDHYRGKLAASRASFDDVWQTVQGEVEAAVNQNDSQKTLLDNALDIVNKMPNQANGGNPFGGPVSNANAGGQVDESAFKNMWNFNLADAAFGYLVLDIEGGRIGTEMRAQGFNFAHRGGKPGSSQQSQPNASSGVSSNTGAASTPTGPAQSRAPNTSTGPPAAQSQAARQPAPQQAPPPYSQAGPKPPGGQANAPSAPTPTSSQAKPQTPQPAGTNVNLPNAAPSPNPAQSNDIRNGTNDKAVDSSAPASSPVERKPPTSLFVTNVETAEQVREIFAEEDKAKLSSIDKQGRNFQVKFASHGEAEAALGRLQAENKRPSPPTARKPYVKWFEERSGGTRPSFHRESQGNQGAGTWQASSRGGSNATPRAGYQSGGASDSEGGRGRGGFGGRGGRAGRGTERGGRGGRGGGRGSFQGKSGDSSSPAPTTPSGDKPAPAPSA
jgi:hypothetical protein